MEETAAPPDTSPFDGLGEPSYGSTTLAMKGQILKAQLGGLADVVRKDYEKEAKLITQLGDEVQSHYGRFDKLQADIAQLQRHRSATAPSIDKPRRDDDTVRAELEMADADVEAVKGQLEQLRKQLAKLKEDVATLTDIRKHLSEEIESLRADRDVLRDSSPLDQVSSLLTTMGLGDLCQVHATLASRLIQVHARRSIVYECKDVDPPATHQESGDERGSHAEAGDEQEPMEHDDHAEHDKPDEQHGTSEQGIERAYGRKGGDEGHPSRKPASRTLLQRVTNHTPGSWKQGGRNLLRRVKSFRFGRPGGHAATPGNMAPVPPIDGRHLRTPEPTGRRYLRTPEARASSGEDNRDSPRTGEKRRYGFRGDVMLSPAKKGKKLQKHQQPSPEKMG
ncbi:hypothetical protein LTR36_004757 [Oleoguttula mirabilis]|uniref:Uncharacterized protein n=1 Tax=Oleoguttula mirabilis TaxID=1507867 RepID=A0AAV9JGK7_9PEZI|nr:hypothetical protein LTR36_004757 [Oleoguttula mirabilis]